MLVRSLAQEVVQNFGLGLFLSEAQRHRLHDLIADDLADARYDMKNTSSDQGSVNRSLSLEYYSATEVSLSLFLEGSYCEDGAYVIVLRFGSSFEHTCNACFIAGG